MIRRIQNVKRPEPMGTMSAPAWKRISAFPLGLLILFSALLLLAGVFTNAVAADEQESETRAPVSETTEVCLGCHSSINPGMVESWAGSRHAAITPEQALEVTGNARKVSAENIPESLRKTAVGCAECHMLNTEAHPDTFEHNGYFVHTVVSPRDCAVCHPVEVEQYGRNIMAHARKNLAENPVFQDLERQTIGKPVIEEGRVEFEAADTATREEACFHCHGTQVMVTGTETRDTILGEMNFPVLSGWPNQGSGRVNPDNTLGSCAACHTRHTFAIEMARKPHTCMQCHIGPDVPAYKVYAASKHGNIYAAKKEKWDFTAVPWRIGKDFTAPTCATCHISLLTNTDGEVVAERTHRMNNRLAWRIFGLIYAHPHPIAPDTTVIRNKDGLPLPTDFDGGFAEGFLIDRAEQDRRDRAMQAICLNCHGESWVRGHWDRFRKTIEETNASTLTATRLMREIWAQGFARGLDEEESPFNESIERTWSNTWLFYANTIRFSSAMAGGGDYGVFANGRYQLSKRIQEMSEWLDLRNQLFPPATPVARRSGLSDDGMTPLSAELSDAPEAVDSPAEGDAP